MTLIKEHKGRRVLSNYNPDVLEKEIFRLTDELERVQRENNRLEARVDSFCARYGYDVEELN